MADPAVPIVIIGISGATWTVIDPMITDGALPNFRKLMREGAWGVLESAKTENDRHYRPQTAWPSLLTGKLPENHGITRYFHTYSDMKSPGIWDFFNAKGLGAGLYSAPILWPPPKINGFVMPAPYGRDSRAWPEDLSFIVDYYRHHQDSKLKRNYFGSLLKSLRFVPVLFGRGQDRSLPIQLLRSAVALSMSRDREKTALILRNAKLDFSTAIFLWLYRKYRPHFCMLTNFELDFVSHRYWRYHEPDKFPDSRGEPRPTLKRAVRDIYAHTDRCIGLLLGHLPPRCIVVIASEHGMAAETNSTEVGKWQYLIDGNRVKALAGIGDDLVAVPIARWIAFRRRDNGALTNGIETLLKNITVAETGLPLFMTHFHTKEEIVIKLNIDRADYPEIDDIGRLRVNISGKGTLPISSILERVGPRRSAMHAKEGIVIIKGPGIRPDLQIKAARIIDIMPTLLFASGIELPCDLDGKVLDVFS